MWHAATGGRLARYLVAGGLVSVLVQVFGGGFHVGQAQGRTGRPTAV
jgi:hypothetical protein